MKYSFYLCCALLVQSVNAQTLTEYFAKAEKRDAQYAAARAQRDADQSYRAIGRAGVMPSVSFGATSANTTYKRQDVGLPGERTYDYSPKMWNFQVTQSIFNADRIVGLREGELRALRADMIFSAAQQDLALRVARAWFSYLLDLDQLQLVEAQLQSLLSQRDQAQRMRTAGIATLTDVEETKARAEIAKAELLTAQASAQMRAREFVRVVGEQPRQLTKEQLAAIDFRRLKVDGEIEDWIESATHSNTTILAQQISYEIAKLQVAKAKAGYMPSLALVASNQRANSSSYATTQETTTQIGLQLNLNFYDGGSTSAQVRQADALVVKAGADLSAQTEEITLKVADAVLAVRSSHLRTEGLVRARSAAEIALQGMEAGTKAGIRTNTEVLNATQQVFAVRRDLAKERYTLALRYAELQLLVGGTAVEALDQLAPSVPQ